MQKLKGRKLKRTVPGSGVREAGLAVSESTGRSDGPPAIVPIEGPEVLDLDLLGVAIGEANVDGCCGRDVPAPEVVLRGMARMIPALTPYLDRLPRCFVDGGYYTKTRENRFLSGPLPVTGAYIIGALSGYGMMASNGAADLLADHIAERPLPPYAAAFRLDRYGDPAYRKLLDDWGDSGQL